MANSMVHYLIQVYIKIEQTLVTKYIYIVVELGMNLALFIPFIIHKQKYLYSNLSVMYQLFITVT